MVKNNNTNETLLAQLAQDEEPFVRLQVAEKTNNEKILEILAVDEDLSVRIVLVDETNNEKILEILAEDEDLFIRDTARKKLQDLKMKAKASSNKINQILKKANLYYKLTTNYLN